MRSALEVAIPLAFTVLLFVTWPTRRGETQTFSADDVAALHAALDDLEAAFDREEDGANG